MPTKAAKAKAKAQEKTEVQENGKLPAGAVPQLVNQRVYDYLPALFQALKEMNVNLEKIVKLLED